MMTLWTMDWTQIAALLTPFAMLGFVALVVAREHTHDQAAAQREHAKSQPTRRR